MKMSRTLNLAKKLTKEQQIIHSLSERIVKAQKPIRILDSIKWDEHVKHEFFHHKCQRQPIVDKNYYKQHPLKFNSEKKREEFYMLERDIKRQLGEFSGIGNILLRMCREYRAVIRMLEARGTANFHEVAKELYGSTFDVFYPGGPTLCDLGDILSNALSSLDSITITELDEKKFTAQAAVKQLKNRLKSYFFDDSDKMNVVLSNGIISDAAAGADKLKLRRDSLFSQRDLNILAVHEGWVHIGTTLNGLNQPICTFLSKGPPSSTIYQEGLAVTMEIITFSSHPRRIKHLNARITGISLAEQGGTFLDIYRYLIKEGLTEEESYRSAARIFRGSTPTLGPFTKDLVYSKGFILIYNYLRLAIQYNQINKIPLLFLGKTSLEDLKVYEQLIEENIVVPPKYIPNPFKDIAALSCWMSYSLFLNKIDLDKLAKNFRTIL